jgi:antitoxin MazE
LKSSIIQIIEIAKILFHFSEQCEGLLDRTMGICQEYPNEERERAMAEAVIGRWGKNLAIRLPAHVAKKAGLSDGERVEIISTDNEVIVRKLPAKLTVESMFSGAPSKDWRALYRTAFDWGEDQGRERVEE